MGTGWRRIIGFRNGLFDGQDWRASHRRVFRFFRALLGLLYTSWTGFSLGVDYFDSRFLLLLLLTIIIGLGISTSY